MSKHRRTKSHGNYFTPPILDQQVDDTYDQENETQAIIQHIQKSNVDHKQIVEKLDSDCQQGMYNSLFHFGKGQIKSNHNTNLSIISECSCNSLFIYFEATPSVNQEQPQSKMILHRKCGSHYTPTVRQHKGHNHSYSLQLTIQQLEYEINQMKVQQKEMQNINKFLIQEIYQSRQDYLMSQQKNEAILQRVAYLEKMLEYQIYQEGQSQIYINNSSTNDSIHILYDEI